MSGLRLGLHRSTRSARAQLYQWLSFDRARRSWPGGARRHRGADAARSPDRPAAGGPGFGDRPVAPTVRSNPGPLPAKAGDGRAAPFRPRAEEHRGARLRWCRIRSPPRCVSKHEALAAAPRRHAPRPPRHSRRARRPRSARHRRGTRAPQDEAEQSPAHLSGPVLETRALLRTRPPGITRLCRLPAGRDPDSRTPPRVTASPR